MEMIRAAVLRSSGVKGPYVQTRPLSIESVALEPPGFGEAIKGEAVLWK